MSSFWQTVMFVLMILVAMGLFILWLYVTDEERKQIRQMAWNEGLLDAYDYELNRLLERQREIEMLRPKDSSPPSYEDPYRQALTNVRLEKRKRDKLDSEHAQPVTQNNYISNSTITNLNLGTVLGDLNASVQSLQNNGAPQIADIIQKLTSGISNSTAIKDADRKDLLENLALISNEVSSEPDKRKPGLLKASLSFMTVGLAAAIELVPLCHDLHEKLKAAGFISW